MALGFFLSLWMIFLDPLGSIWCNISPMHIYCWNLSLSSFSLNLIFISKLFELTMVLSSTCHNFILPKGSYTNTHVLELLNKMVLSNINTNIFWMLLAHFVFRLICHSIFGRIVFLLTHISLIELHRLFFETNLHMRFYFQLNQITHIYVYLVVYALLQTFTIIDPNLMFELDLVFL